MTLLFYILFLMMFSCSIDYAPINAEKILPIEFNNRPGDFISGKIVALEYYGQAVREYHPYQPSGLAGFGGGKRRFLPPYLQGRENNFTYFAPFEKVDLYPRIKASIWKGNNTSNAAEHFLLLSFDTVAITSDITQKLIASLNKGKSNITWNQGNINIIATHTHSGPAGLSQNPLWETLASDKYSPRAYELFENVTLNTVEEALQHMVPIETLQKRRVVVPDLNRSRIPEMNVENQAIQLNFLSRGVSAGCLQVFAVHPTAFGQSQRILSSDIAGHIEQSFQKNYGYECFFLNGAEGNASAQYSKNLPEHIDEYAEEFVQSWKKTAAETEELRNPKISYGTVFVELPQPKINFYGCGFTALEYFVNTNFLDALPHITKISYLLINDAHMVLFFPGEPTFSVAQNFSYAFRQKYSSIKSFQIVSLANDYLAYVTDSNFYHKKNLEACSTLYGDHIFENLWAQLDKVNFIQ